MLFSLKPKKKAARQWPAPQERTSILLDGITKDHLGLEIGPYFNPLVPKSKGYNSYSIDVFNEDQLRKRALEDPWIDNNDIQ